MKKIISLVCAGFILASPISAFCDSFPAMDFESFAGNSETLDVLPAGNDQGSFRFNYGKPGTDGVRAVKTDKGTSLELINKTQTYLSLIYQLKKPTTESVKVNTSVRFEDFNSGRTLQLRPSVTSNAYNAFYFETSGNVYAFEKKIDGFKTETGVWYDILLKYNVKSSYYSWKISYAGGEISGDGYYPKGLKNLPDVSMILFGYTGRKDTSRTVYDDMAINITAPNYPDISENHNFEGLSDLPLGIVKTGGAELSGKGVVLSSSLPGKNGISYSFPAEVYGSYRFDFDMLPEGGESVFALNGETVAGFGGGKIYFLGEEKGTYQDGEAVKVKVTADTASKKLSLTVGEVAVAEAAMGETLLPVKNAEIYSNGGGSGETLIKSFAVNQNEGLYIKSLTPDAEIFSVLPDEVILEYSNPVADMGTYSVGTVQLTPEKRDEKHIAIPVSELEYGKSYEVSVSGVSDILGNGFNGKFNINIKPEYVLSNALLSADGAAVTASVSGAVYDGSDKSFKIALAVFGENNELLSLFANDAVLSGSIKEYSVSAPYTEGNYCEAYVWDSFESMNVFGKCAALGNEPLKELSVTENGVHEDMDTGIVTVSGANIAGGTATVLILKPGKTPEDIKDNASFADCVAFIKQFDSREKDVFAFYPGDNGGKYGMLVVKDGKKEYKPEFLDYISPKRIKEALAEVNKAELDLKKTVAQYNDVFNMDLTELEALNDERSAFLSDYILNYRKDAENGIFDSVEHFKTAYNKGFAAMYLKFAESGDDVKKAFEKYGAEIGIEKFDAYKTFSEQKERVKEKIYADIAGRANEADLNTVFGEQTVLRAIEGAANQANVGAVITENNSFLKFDLTDYLNLKNKVPVNRGLSGKYFNTVTNLYDEFLKLAAKQKKAESTEGYKPSSSGGGSGSAQKVELPNTSKQDDKTAVFEDMSGFEWAEEAVYALCEKEIITGRGKNIFDPAAGITREEFTKLALLAFSKFDDKAESGFIDANKNAWYYPYISSAYKNGIVFGKSENVFGVGNKITRQDMAVIICRAAGIPSENVAKADFADYDRIDDYAKAAVSALYGEKIVSGTGAGYFEPLKFATRAEAAKMIYEAMKKGGFGK